MQNGAVAPDWGSAYSLLMGRQQVLKVKLELLHVREQVQIDSCDNYTVDVGRCTLGRVAKCSIVTQTHLDVVVTYQVTVVTF